MTLTSAALKNELRLTIRRRRQALSKHQLQRASQLCGRHILNHLSSQRLKHIALYAGNDGEIDPFPLCQQLLKRRKRVYLPVLDPLRPGRLIFCEYRPGAPLISNRFGIVEPDLKLARRMKVQFLSALLMPLVAFDHKRNRMGMGGGYYDRSLSYTQTRPWRRAKLVGLAYEFQQVEKLPTEPWDIPLDRVITEAGEY